jgi:acetyl esterase/lipase
MDAALIAPELRGPLLWLPPLPIGNRFILRLLRAAGRRIPATKADDVRVEDLAVAGPRLRLYEPMQKPTSAALFWIHGGGYVLGNPRQDDARCVDLARTLGVTVVSVDYRLAPEHPFPAPLDDCHAGWMWLHANATSLGVSPERIGLGGQSAGGGLAACLVQRLCAAGDPMPVAQLLIAPMLDDRTATRRELDAAKYLVWSNRTNLVGWRCYLNGEPGTATVPDFAVAARRDDLSGLPPTWIGVGDIDLFHEEDLAYAERLRSAGVPVTVDVVPGAPHGFDSWAAGSELGRGFNARGAEWLRQTLGA